MFSAFARTSRPAADRFIHGLRRGHALWLMPAIVGAAWLFGGPVATAFVALVFPVALAITLPPSPGEPTRREVDRVTGLPLRPALVAALDRALRAGQRSDQCTAALVVEIDRFKLIEERHDRAAVERILRMTGERLQDVLRETDMAARLDGPSFGIVLNPARRLNLESAIQLSSRVQRALAEPLAVDGTNVYVTASVGFALSNRVQDLSGEALLQAAAMAMIEAGRSGPAAIRSYSQSLRSRVDSRNSLSDEIAGALDRGEVMAFFQPQISTRTGAVTGFETLARWHHPDRGLIPPIEFLPALQQAGLMDRLGEIMIFDALTALRHWDEIGFDIPRVGVNFSNEELRDPRLTDRLRWELDRFELTPDRLGIEVLETVVADRSDDIIVRNLAGLARMGCAIDLDDFGTGHASITNIRRFAIGRIKIDRTFVTRIDADSEQQNMVSAILTMAERLGLDTLAEGVETAGEHQMLAQLGCGHVQGFGIARPMPIAETDGWIRAYQARLAGPVSLPRRTG